MDIELTGKKALVVGASGGMGRDIALALSREGVACALMGRNSEILTELADACAESGVPAVPIVCDIGKTETIEGAVAQAVDGLGGLNFLVNCAGNYVGAKAQEVDLDAWDNVLEVGFKAHYHLARYALPEINKAPGGAVVKIGSVGNTYSGAGMQLAITRGIDGFSDALFEDVREFGTKVCVIKPGYVNTPLARSDRTDQNLMIQPADVSRTVLFVLTMPGTACPTEIVMRPQRSPYRTD